MKNQSTRKLENFIALRHMSDKEFGVGLKDMKRLA